MSRDKERSESRHIKKITEIKERRNRVSKLVYPLEIPTYQSRHLDDGKNVAIGTALDAEHRKSGLVLPNLAGKVS